VPTAPNNAINKILKRAPIRDVKNFNAGNEPLKTKNSWHRLGSQESSDPEKIIRSGYGELHRRKIFSSLTLSTKCKSHFRNTVLTGSLCRSIVKPVA
jgi:hypothetical protein